MERVGLNMFNILVSGSWEYNFREFDRVGEREIETAGRDMRRLNIKNIKSRDNERGCRNGERAWKRWRVCTRQPLGVY